MPRRPPPLPSYESELNRANGRLLWACQTSITDAELKEVFAGFMLEQDRDKMLIAEHYDRGFAFVDLGSQEVTPKGGGRLWLVIDG